MAVPVDGKERLCFICDRKPRVSGEVACRSCLQEHRKCYECGENDRNFPFKLCTACHGAHIARTSGAPAVPTVQPVRRSGAGEKYKKSTFFLCVLPCMCITLRSCSSKSGPADVQGSERALCQGVGEDDHRVSLASTARGHLCRSEPETGGCVSQIRRQTAQGVLDGIGKLGPLFPRDNPQV